jgi:sporulation protein YtfJ
MQTESEKSKINQMMGITIDKIREMGDVKTVIGDPILAGDTTIIPVSKVSYGFASGGSDLPAKQNPKDLFGGGAGAGVTVQPIAFLIINKDGNVRLIQVSASDDKVSNIIRSVPELLDKISDMIKEHKDKKSEEVTLETAE